MDSYNDQQQKFTYGRRNVARNMFKSAVPQDFEDTTLEKLERDIKRGKQQEYIQIDKVMICRIQRLETYLFPL